jgi:hypothetical protein
VAKETVEVWYYKNEKDREAHDIRKSVGYEKTDDGKRVKKVGTKTVYSWESKTTALH